MSPVSTFNTGKYMAVCMMPLLLNTVVTSSGSVSVPNGAGMKSRAIAVNAVEAAAPYRR